MLKAIETVYSGIDYRSRIEARWAVVFDTLDVEYYYEPEHYELGLKNEWTDNDEESMQEAINQCWDSEDIDHIKREAWWKKHEKLMYLPDFWLPEFKHWVEIKGKEPNFEEIRKANLIVRRRGEPISILWGNIPDPRAKLWGECTQVFGSDMNIIALLVLECGVKAVERAYTVARQVRFEHR